MDEEEAELRFNFMNWPREMLGKDQNDQKDQKLLIRCLRSADHFKEWTVGNKSVHTKLFLAHSVS